jgi:hypothetical protein
MLYIVTNIGNTKRKCIACKKIIKPGENVVGHITGTYYKFVNYRYQHVNCINHEGDRDISGRGG